MSKEQIITLILFLVIVVLIHYMNKINRHSLKEQFKNHEKLDGRIINEIA